VHHHRHLAEVAGATAALQRVFMTLSELGRSADRCDPTKTTGTGVLSMNLTAAAE